MLISQTSYPKLWAFCQKHVEKKDLITIECGTDEEINHTENKLNELSSQDFSVFLENPYDKEIVLKLGTYESLPMEVISHLKQMGW